MSALEAMRDAAAAYMPVRLADELTNNVACAIRCGGLTDRLEIARAAQTAVERRAQLMGLDVASPLQVACDMAHAWCEVAGLGAEVAS